MLDKNFMLISSEMIRIFVTKPSNERAFGSSSGYTESPTLQSIKKPVDK